MHRYLIQIISFGSSKEQKSEFETDTCFLVASFLSNFEVGIKHEIIIAFIYKIVIREKQSYPRASWQS